MKKLFSKTKKYAMYAVDFTGWGVGYLLHCMLLTFIGCVAVLIVSEWHQIGWLLLSALVIRIAFANYKD